MEHEYTEGICGNGAAILRDGVMMPIEDIVGTLNALQSERDEAQAALARLVPGVVRIPEPMDVEIEAELSKVWPVGEGWRLGFRDGLAWARTHAEVVVEAVELTGPMLREIIDESFDPAPRTESGLALVDDIIATKINARLRARQPQPPTTREVERLRKDREECLGSIDAFLGEASRWIERDGSMFDGDLCEIADRRLRYTLDALRSTTGGA